MVNKGKYILVNEDLFIDNIDILYCLMKETIEFLGNSKIEERLTKDEAYRYRTFIDVRDSLENLKLKGSL